MSSLSFIKYFAFLVRRPKCKCAFFHFVFHLTCSHAIIQLVQFPFWSLLHSPPYSPPTWFGIVNKFGSLTLGLLNQIVNKVVLNYWSLWHPSVTGCQSEKYLFITMKCPESKIKCDLSPFHIDWPVWHQHLLQISSPINLLLLCNHILILFPSWFCNEVVTLWF